MFFHGYFIDCCQKASTTSFSSLLRKAVAKWVLKKNDFLTRFGHSRDRFVVTFLFSHLRKGSVSVSLLGPSNWQGIMGICTVGFEEVFQF